VERSAQAADGAYRRHYSKVSKQASAFRVHSAFRTCFVEVGRSPAGTNPLDFGGGPDSFVDPGLGFFTISR